MSFLEVKGSLAKLLATENLHVQHDGVATTASFNTATRVLTLPILKTEDSHVYDMFVGHEVGHALWTPNDWADKVDSDIPFDFINVIEDCRIEKAIQDKFPGLKVDFAKGYDTLHEQDFFDVADKNIGEMNLIDRINLHFKLGDRALIPFSPIEQVYVDAVDEADTFDKVLNVAKKLADYCDAKRKQEQETQTSMDMSGDGPEDDNKQEGDSDDTKPEESDTTESKQADSKEGGDENISQTQRAMDEALSQMAEHDNHKSPSYINAPTEPLRPYPIEFLREDFTTMAEALNQNSVAMTRDLFDTFMRGIKRDVNFMVQQFEMKKSADAYARQQIHKTGVLNTELLHNYKLTDDLFLRQTVTPDGKNHGLYMLVDWSGSMSDHILETVKQILVLVQFCRKVNIPFEVVTFTCQGYGVRLDHDGTLPKQGDVAGKLSVTQVLSSKEKRRDTDTDMFHFFCQARRISYQYSGAPYSSRLSMGGTPLNNVLAFMPVTLEKFKKDNNIQRLSFVCLTDGESSPLHFVSDRPGGGYNMTMTTPWTPTLIRDGHKVYQIDSTRETPSMINYITKRVPDVTVTNIYLTGPKGALSYYANMTSQSVSELPEYKKEGSYTFTTKNGWPLVALVNPRSFTDSTDELEVEQGAGKSKVKSALKKFLKNKTTSKVLLSTLVTQFS